MKSLRKGGILSFLVVASLFCSGSLWATVGETEAQVAARYGKPVSRKHGVSKHHRLCAYTFQKTYGVLVQFVDGVSQWENYSVDGRPLSAGEVRMFLAMNSARVITTRFPPE